MGMKIGDQNGNWYEIGEIVNGSDVYKGELLQEGAHDYQFSFGQMQLKEMLLPNMYIIRADMQLAQSGFQLKATSSRDIVELNFTLGGSGSFTNNISGFHHRFTDRQHNILYAREFEGTAEYGTNGVHAHFEIHFNRDYFVKLFENSNPALEKFAGKVAAGQDSMAGIKSLTMTPEMHACIDKITNNPYTGMLRQMYVQSKCYDLLTLQAESINAAFGKSMPKTVLKNAYDKECIQYAQEYLLQHADAPPSLTQLATIAGTNTFKLKNGFKELYNNTVFGYLNEAKLKRSKDLLRAGIAIKEVASQLGYSSVQHFSTAFKKQYGFTPAQAR
ncbi:helix-turn-helix transcriptional regulator [Filimonas lacunae]|nr:AraC family transcriptional regulator [Filimonas lacunae]BAV06551.1 transcriptional regulator, AraC family [Filimonas lacunae]